MTFKTGVKINKVSKGMQLFFADRLTYQKPSKLRQTPNLAKPKDLTISLLKKNLTLPLAGQENFYVFWKTILKNALNYEKNLRPHYNCISNGIICK
jgi:hypothetical protein